MGREPSWRLIPWSMYHFCRRTIGETSACIALLLGCFWYELVGFAHKPMSEFIATNLLMLSLMMLVSPAFGTKKLYTAAFGALIAICIALRFQYGALCVIIGLWGMWNIWKLDKQMVWYLLGGGVVTLFAVGLFEVITWGDWFHSYFTNYKFNVLHSERRLNESPIFQYLLWLLIGGFGLPLLAVGAGILRWSQLKLPVILLLTLVVIHSIQPHREYRFIFAAIPLYLLLLAALITPFFVEYKRRLVVYVFGVFIAGVSVAGISNALPFQQSVYEGFSRGKNVVSFIRQHDPLLDVYRHISTDEDVKGVMQYNRNYFNTGGYYMLHHAIPFYDHVRMLHIFSYNSAETIIGRLHEYVSHVVIPTLPLGKRSIIHSFG